MSAPILDVRNVRLARGARDVLRGVSFGASRGELLAVMAPSGGGKTTVLRAVAALEPFDAGEVHVDGVRLGPGRLPRERHLRDLRRRVGMVFQLHHLFEHLTAVANVTLAPVHALKMRRDAAEARAMALLDSLGVASRARALPRELSGGEAQRVAIARALATDPPLLLLDEPTAMLDPARSGELGEALKSLAASGRALVVTTHDDDFAREFADRVAILADGRVVEQGDARQVLTSPQHPATQALLQHDGDPGRRTCPSALRRAQGRPERSRGTASSGHPECIEG